MKKKVIIIGPGMEIGGVERSLLGLLDSIDYEKYEVDLFLFSHTGDFISSVNGNISLMPENKILSLINQSIIRLIITGHFYVAFVRLCTKIYGELRARFTNTETMSNTVCKKYITKKVTPISKHYDVALGFFGPHYFLEEKVDADVKIGWVHTDYSNANEIPDVKYITPMWDKLDAIACVSEGVKNAFDSVFPTLADKTIVVENILSPELIRKQADELIPDEMNFDGMKVLSVGRFSTAKNFDNIPKICSILAEKGYKFKWYLIGYGPDEKLIKSKIKEYNMEDYVVLLGKKENPYPYMKNCDIYVQPSRYEGKAVTVREAQILNKPVVITRFDTAASQVEEGVDGYICELSVDGIANGIEYMINNPDIRNKLIENTKKRDYSNSDQFEKLMELIK